MFHILTVLKSLDVCKAAEQSQSSTFPPHKSKEQKLLGNLTELLPFYCWNFYFTLLQQCTNVQGKSIISVNAVITNIQTVIRGSLSFTAVLFPGHCCYRELGAAHKHCLAMLKHLAGTLLSCGNQKLPEQESPFPSIPNLMFNNKGYISDRERDANCSVKQACTWSPQPFHSNLKVKRWLWTSTCMHGEGTAKLKVWK